MITGDAIVDALMWIECRFRKAVVFGSGSTGSTVARSPCVLTRASSRQVRTRGPIRLAEAGAVEAAKPPATGSSAEPTRNPLRHRDQRSIRHPLDDNAACRQTALIGMVGAVRHLQRLRPGGYRRHPRRVPLPMRRESRRFTGRNSSAVDTGNRGGAVGESTDHACPVLIFWWLFRRRPPFFGSRERGGVPVRRQTAPVGTARLAFWRLVSCTPMCSRYERNTPPRVAFDGEPDVAGLHSSRPATSRFSAHRP